MLSLQSHDEHSDDEMRDCDSVDGEHMNGIGAGTGRLNSSLTSNGGDMSYASGGVGIGGGGRSPDPQTEMQMR